MSSDITVISRNLISIFGNVTPTNANLACHLTTSFIQNSNNSRNDVLVMQSTPDQFRLLFDPKSATEGIVNKTELQKAGFDVRSSVTAISVPFECFTSKIFPRIQNQEDFLFWQISKNSVQIYLEEQFFRNVVLSLVENCETTGIRTRGPNDYVKRWWYENRSRLLQLMAENKTNSPIYVYFLPKIDEQVKACLSSLQHVDRIWYAVKANTNPKVLSAISKAKITGGFECVSIDELKFVRANLPTLPKDKILFSPNFASRLEYEQAFELCSFVTIDNDWAVENWPDVFKNRQVFLRLDPGDFFMANQDKQLHQHHYLKTAGSSSKFGVLLSSTDDAVRLKQKFDQQNCRVIGLHLHRGSQITDPKSWSNVSRFLAEIAQNFPDVRYINIGGGLFVNYDYTKDSSFLNLSKVDQFLAEVKQKHSFEFWMEPGRFFVAEAGVLLAQVTQLKPKSGRRFIGTTAGMNSLIRPALYDSYHEIVNLTRIDDSGDESVGDEVVGPICESSDFLGKQRNLPAATNEGDVILIDTAGAYGKVMASFYNMRQIPDEKILD